MRDGKGLSRGELRDEGGHQGYLPSCSVASEIGEGAREPAVDFIKR